MKRLTLAKKAGKGFDSRHPAARLMVARVGLFAKKGRAL
jgi:hypothetical protein